MGLLVAIIEMMAGTASHVAEVIMMMMMVIMMNMMAGIAAQVPEVKVMMMMMNMMAGKSAGMAEVMIIMMMNIMAGTAANKAEVMMMMMIMNMMAGRAALVTDMADILLLLLDPVKVSLFLHICSFPLCWSGFCSCSSKVSHSCFFQMFFLTFLATRFIYPTVSVPALAP